MSTNEQPQPRLLTHEELAALIKLFRHIRGWSQEQLADISGLSARTIQRIEQNAPSSLDTRRAIAKAFEFEDIDALSKPFMIPTDEEVAEAKKKFDSENIMLKATALTTGRQFARLVEANSMDLSVPAFEMSRAADEEFAELVDYFREYRDCSDLYSELQKFEVYDVLQDYIDKLKQLDVSLCYSVRKLLLKFGTDADVTPTPTTALYVVAFPLGKEPTEFATPRSAGIKL
ncbi:helix-turn-helix domain-containing protein [Janthinobacterium agaricidamnosum]|uniref:helix-turn-helix domain-containing protein n=1 Tax=Janthinobacterium agaricidamnosum TaxID=55508 RepID=UPI000570160F|nr:helix-turn-helix transcriptional regulator [Janthinobacterium agaricidamnosum]